MSRGRARAALAALYDSPEWLRWPARCPLDNSRAHPDWLHLHGVRLGFLRCERQHVLRWDCCGKKKGRQLARKRAG